MLCKLLNTELGAIEYASVGKGIPLLFLHGGHSNCYETLAHKGFDLERFQLITPSRPGYGQTPLNDHQTPKQAADLVIELVTHLSLDQLIVYGISAGGPTAIELAANYPEKVSGLILASAISKKWLDENEKTYKVAQRIFNPKMEKVTWGMVRFFSRLMPGMIAKSFYPQFSMLPAHPLKKEDVQELIASMKHYNSGTGFLNDIDQVIEEATLKKVKCPTLIIHSESDSSVPLDHAQHAHEMIERSKLEILHNEWGHLFWIGSDSMGSIAITMEFINALNNRSGTNWF